MNEYKQKDVSLNWKTGLKNMNQGTGNSIHQPQCPDRLKGCLQYAQVSTFPIYRFWTDTRTYLKKRILV